MKTKLTPISDNLERILKSRARFCELRVVPSILKLNLADVFASPCEPKHGKNS